MILLQDGSGSAENVGGGNEFIFYLEIVMLIVIGIRQLYLTYKYYNKIQELKNVFKHNLFIINRFIDKQQLFSVINESVHIADDGIGEEAESDIDGIGEEAESDVDGEQIVKLSLVDTYGNSPIIKRIKKGINTYLINNYGAAVNFSIIKDIIDREVDAKDEEISQSVTVPLYLGLGATMLGIVLGLWAMPSIDGDNFSNGINALIEGVQYAMLASLLGLVCTTLLSSRFYKQAKAQTLKEKNTQLSYLQAKLLPELIRAEDTGVSGLKASLDRFARVATEISDNVLIASNQTGENLVLQQEVIDKIESMKVLKVTKWNLELFNKLETNMEALSKFSTYLNQIEDISSNLLEFSQRTTNIDQVIHHIDSTLTESNKLSKFLSLHFDRIEASGSAALKAVGLAETQFEDAIESLKGRTDEMIDQLYKSSGNHEIKLEQIYKNINENVNQIATDYIEKFSKAYTGSVPRFEQLENLSLLPEFKSDSNTNAQELISRVNEMKESLKSLSNFDYRITNNPNKKKNRDLFSEVDEGGTIPQSDNRPKKEEPLTIRALIQKVFSNGRSKN